MRFWGEERKGKRGGEVYPDLSGIGTPYFSYRETRYVKQRKADLTLVSNGVKGMLHSIAHIGMAYIKEAMGTATMMAPMSSRAEIGGRIKVSCAGTIRCRQTDQTVGFQTNVRSISDRPVGWVLGSRGSVSGLYLP